ncbi:Cyclin, N-terminal domain-containing protein [Cladochytrium replicatum]|nr:Cyclin, N-terminal domain-containing protein [Cladochytrium replicatum]
MPKRQRSAEPCVKPAEYEELPPLDTILGESRIPRSGLDHPRKIVVRNYQPRWEDLAPLGNAQHPPFSLPMIPLQTPSPAYYNSQTASQFDSYYLPTPMSPRAYWDGGNYPRLQHPTYAPAYYRWQSTDDVGCSHFISVETPKFSEGLCRNKSPTRRDYRFTDNLSSLSSYATASVQGSRKEESACSSSSYRDSSVGAGSELQPLQTLLVAPGGIDCRHVVLERGCEGNSDSNWIQYDGRLNWTGEDASERQPNQWIIIPQPRPAVSEHGEEEDCAVTAVIAPPQKPLDLDIEPTNRLKALVRESDGKHMPDFHYFANAQEGKMRPIVRADIVAFLESLVKEFTLMQSTLYLAMNYYDRYLSVVKITQKRQLYTLGTACLAIAAKFDDELSVPPLAELVEWAAVSCQGIIPASTGLKFVQKMERKVVSALNWELAACTPHSVAEEILASIPNENFGYGQTELMGHVRHCVQRSVRDLSYMDFSPGSIAFGALHMLDEMSVEYLMDQLNLPQVL